MHDVYHSATMYYTNAGINNSSLYGSSTYTMPYYPLDCNIMLRHNSPAHDTNDN